MELVPQFVYPLDFTVSYFHRLIYADMQFNTIDLAKLINIFNLNAAPISLGAAKERWAAVEQSRQDVEEAAPRNGFRVGGDLRKWQTRSAVAFRDVGRRRVSKGRGTSIALWLWCGTSSSTTLANAVCNHAVISAKRSLVWRSHQAFATAGCNDCQP
ncbi:hypothetical protein JYB87_05070 [Shewanella avicenniae]|uniref:Uncharacterized protein n=1 Tax=Shewanella avicenniae TaxID=2814294 RepID=A0ABX7QT59_9GAMM|nr:hypothetical protein [Shewanella avicenniae]QSX34614.1 hypothetical protein JYB87_05070 [Shewanella avicenniae]